MRKTGKTGRSTTGPALPVITPETGIGSGTTGPALPVITRETSGTRKWHNRPSTSGHQAGDRNQEVAQQAQHFRSSRGRQESGSGTTGPALPVITLWIKIWKLCQPGMKDFDLT
jgi:hypothetical protein